MVLGGRYTKFMSSWRSRTVWGWGRGIVEEHQDLEGEALTEAILLKLGLELVLDVRLEDVPRHPSSLIGVPAHREQVLGVTLKGTRVLGVVHQDGLQLTVPRQVRPQQEGETVLICLEAWVRLLFLCNVRAFKHFLPLKVRFVHIENLLGLVTPLLDHSPQLVRESSSSVSISALRLTRALDASEGMSGLEIKKPAPAGHKLWDGAGFLGFEVFVHLQGLLLGILRRHT